MLLTRDLSNCNLTRTYYFQSECNSFPTKRLVNNTTTTNRTALIAGLVTGLVGFTILLVTILGIVYYKRRKRRANEKLSPHPPIVIYDITTVLPPPPPPPPAMLSPITNQWQTTEYLDYDHPHSPFIIGAQSLQIPHLDSPDPSNATLIRRSLNIQPTTTVDYTQLNRASSVKVTKYDHRLIPAQSTITKRGVSVKKNKSTNSHSSSITKVGSVHSENAKPTTIAKKPYSNIPEDDNRIDLYFIPSLPSQVSIQTSNSTSTLGDGEITVYLQPDISSSHM